jgi:AcrR family transcriptional regulator
MARTAGARNTDFELRRNALIEKARSRLGEAGTPPASYRALAAAAGVSVSTLRHYFPNREALVAAVLAWARQGGERHLQRARSPLEGDLRASLHEFLQNIANGWTRGMVGSIHRIGLAEGLRDPAAGLDYLIEVLEPILQAGEERLGCHIERGEMMEADTRHAALVLLAPIVLALLHQHELGGTRCRPLDVQQLIGLHVETFVRAYGPRK